MKKICHICFGLILCYQVQAQLPTNHITSSDYRDASGSGPYPVYIGVGFAKTWVHKDFIDFRNAFGTNSNRKPKRLRGMGVLLGASIKPEGGKFPLPIVVEVRGYSYNRKVKKTDTGSISMSINQVSFGLGGRYAFFPFVVQLQFGPVLYYREAYYAIIDEVKYRQIDNYKFGWNKWTGIGRISFLDPAGTGGGFGLYAEWGFSWLNISNPTSNDVLDMFELKGISGKTNHGYFSFGVIIPLAVTIK